VEGAEDDDGGGWVARVVRTWTELSRSGTKENCEFKPIPDLPTGGTNNSFSASGPLNGCFYQTKQKKQRETNKETKPP
jgi:hypothetical protein